MLRRFADMVPLNPLYIIGSRANGHEQLKSLATL
jgi:hypothetical protein